MAPFSVTTARPAPCTKPPSERRLPSWRHSRTSTVADGQWQNATRAFENRSARYCTRARPRRGVARDVASGVLGWLLPAAECGGTRSHTPHWLLSDPPCTHILFARFDRQVTRPARPGKASKAVRVLGSLPRCLLLSFVTLQRKSTQVATMMNEQRKTPHADSLHPGHVSTFGADAIRKAWLSRRQCTITMHWLVSSGTGPKLTS